MWPAAIAGLILSALIAGGIVVANAFENQQVINQDRFPGMGPSNDDGEEEAPEENEQAPMPALPPPDGG